MSEPDASYSSETIQNTRVKVKPKKNPELWEKKKTIKQGIGFAFIGTLGVIINGIIFSALSQIEAFRGLPLDWWIFKEITWAWNRDFSCIRMEFFNE